MSTEVVQVEFWGRLRFAIKAFFAILFLRPIVAYYDDEQMYARSNFMLMAKMTATMVSLCEHIAEHHDEMVISFDSLSYDENRKN